MHQEIPLRSEANIQLSDDFDLLDRMMKDLCSADDRYKPTNYWKFYEKRFLPELKRKGLRDIRRRKESVLRSFGAVDLPVKGYLRVRWKGPGSSKINSLVNTAIERFPLVSQTFLDSDPRWVTDYFYYYVKNKYLKVGLSLNECPTTVHGNPQDLIEIDGGLWSFKHLNFCSILADAMEHIPFKPDTILCELGAGLGRNAHIVAQLFKKATLLLFDIPPQLYVCNQFLAASLGDRVIPYGDALAIRPLENGQLPESIRGKILVLPTWKMPEWAKTKMDVFWNSESFQEMEVDIVENYLSLVKTMLADYIYINAYPGGAGWIQSRRNGGGTKQAVTESYYHNFLQDLYELRATYFTDNFLRRKDYKSWVFKRKF